MKSSLGIHLLVWGGVQDDYTVDTTSLNYSTVKNVINIVRRLGV